MTFVRPAVKIAPAASTGNNTHASTNIPEDVSSFCAQFVVEAVGATPTVTYKYQVSLEGLDVTDANSNWTDLWFITEATDTAATTARTVTAVGVTHVFPGLGLGAARYWRKIRCVTSANTNVTYRAEFYGLRFHTDW